MKVALCLLCVFAMASAESWVAAPYTLVKRGNVNITAISPSNNVCISRVTGASTRASEIQRQPPGEQQQKRRHQH